MDRVCRDCDSDAPLDDDDRCEGCAVAFALYRGQWRYGRPAQ